MRIDDVGDGNKIRGGLYIFYGRPDESIESAEESNLLLSPHLVSRLFQSHHPVPAASYSPQLITHIRLLRNRTLQPPRLQRTPHIPNIPQLHLRLRFLRPRTHVRQQHHFRVIHQTRVDLRFVFVNVETAAGDLALIKSPAPRMSVVTMP